MSNQLKENRSPNIQCEVCHTPVYRRPWELKKYKHIFCSIACRKSPKSVHGLTVICQMCAKPFVAKHSYSKYCSRSCGNKTRTGQIYAINGSYQSIRHQKK